MDVKKFLAQINKNDLARQNLYAVRFASLQDTAKQILNTGQAIYNADLTDIKGIGVADALQSTAKLFGTGFEMERNIGMMVKSVNIPGSTFETDVDKSRRRPHHVVKAKTDESVTMSLYLSSDHPERKMLMGWFKQIYSNESAQVGFFANYARTIEIYTYNRDSKMVTMTSLKNAFPTRVGGVQLGYENNNTVAEFEAEFVYESATYMTEDISGALSDAVGGVLSGELGERYAQGGFEGAFNSLYKTGSDAISGLF